MRNLRMAW